MSDEISRKQAKTVYNTLCEALDDREWRYQKNEDELSIECRVRGDDLEIDIRMHIDEEQQVILLLSQMPFAVAEDKRSAVAVAVACANNGLPDGCFEFNFISGNIGFRMASGYRESLIGKGLIEYMISASVTVIDEYNDKFFHVSKNKMSYDEIVEYVK